MNPRKSDAVAKRSPLNLRTTADLRAKLDETAAANGRSVTREVELRLFASFDAQPPAQDIRQVVREEVEAALQRRDEAKRFGPDTSLLDSKSAAARANLPDDLFEALWSGRRSGVVRVGKTTIGKTLSSL